MPSITRPNFFTNQFLQAQDLLAEQKYHLEMRRRLNHTFFTAGVAVGLTVAATTDNSGVTVGPGIAIDGNGREVVVNDLIPFALPSTSTPSSILILAVKSTDTIAAGDADANNNAIRFTETPVLNWFNPADPALQDGTNVTLAKVSLDATGKVARNGVDPSSRPNAGPNLPIHGVSLSNLNTKTFESDSAVPLAASATSRIDVPPQPVGRSVFCLIDVYPTTVGGSLSWQWDISTKADGVGGTNQVHRAVVVTNTSPNSLTINYHYKIVVINDV